MREDFTKIIRETGRKRWKPATKTRRKVRVEEINSDFGPTFISSSSKRQKYYSGYHHIRTQPIERFLMCNLGRLWNEVYSEICEVLDKRSFEGSTLTRQLSSFIEDNIEKDGEYYYTLKYYTSLAEFYIDPITGILQYQDRKEILRKLRKAKKIADKKIIIKESIEFKEVYEYIDGFWYYLKYYTYSIDSRPIYLLDGVTLYGPRIYKELVDEKRRLTDEELIKNGLRNYNSRFNKKEDAKKEVKERYNKLEVWRQRGSYKPYQH